MTHIENVQTLIDNAVKVVGSKSKLARELGVSPQRINDWFAGICTCSPEDRARVAAFAHEDAVQELVRATLEKHEGTLRGDQLRQVLGKWLQATGGAGRIVGPSIVSLICFMTVINIPRCIKRKVRKRQYLLC